MLLSWAGKQQVRVRVWVAHNIVCVVRAAHNLAKLAKSDCLLE
jgi:hypothetical protein